MLASRVLLCLHHWAGHGPLCISVYESVHMCAYVCVWGQVCMGMYLWACVAQTGTYCVSDTHHSLHTIPLAPSQGCITHVLFTLTHLTWHPFPDTCDVLSPLCLLLSPISQEVSTKYLNFTASEKTSHIIEHQYQVGSWEGGWEGNQCNWNAEIMMREMHQVTSMCQALF